jgi:hypothetical protein
MVGGKVVEAFTCVVRGESRVWINTQDRHEGECAIYVESSWPARSVSEGDSIWWQGPWAMWTPKSRAFSDLKLRRIGFSGVNRPSRAETGERHD